MPRITVVGGTEFVLDNAEFVVECPYCEEPNQTSLGEDFEECCECEGTIFLDNCAILEPSKQ